jgi:gamma-glutamyltranspeptidase
MTAQDAVAANRIHDQIQPKKTCLERAKEGATKGHTEAQARALEAKGHTIEWLPRESCSSTLHRSS